MSNYKIRPILFIGWYILIIILMIVLLYTDFQWFNHWWIIIPYLILCSLVRPIIDKIAPKSEGKEDEK